MDTHTQTHTNTCTQTHTHTQKENYKNLIKATPRMYYIRGLAANVEASKGAVLLETILRRTFVQTITEYDCSHLFLPCFCCMYFVYTVPHLQKWWRTPWKMLINSNWLLWRCWRISLRQVFLLTLFKAFNFNHDVHEQGAQQLDTKCHCIVMETAWACRMEAGKRDTNFDEPFLTFCSSQLNFSSPRCYFTGYDNSNNNEKAAPWPIL